jgi:hypothetical protein
MHISGGAALLLQALELFQRVGQVAESEGHHPDLHLEGELLLLSMLRLVGMAA